MGLLGIKVEQDTGQKGQDRALNYDYLILEKKKSRDYGDFVDFPRENKMGPTIGQKRTPMEVGEDCPSQGFCCQEQKPDYNDYRQKERIFTIKTREWYPEPKGGF